MCVEVTALPDVRVARCVALLDAKGPADWRQKIDPYRVSVNDSCRCPLAQVYGSFTRGVEALGLFNRKWGGTGGMWGAFGVCCPPKEAEALRRAWAQALAK